jgi:ubiquinone/menaquinone biosynthesis C-methylase UbiE
MTTAPLPKEFLPGMGVDWLLPLYDPFTSLIGLNRARRRLISLAALQPQHRVLDVGCGTGTLAVLVKQLQPGVEVVGVDPDPQALARATRKARRAGAAIRFDPGFADALGYPPASVDRVLSSFMFHHLTRDDKAKAIAEIRRVLKPGGRLCLLDFGGPDAAMRGQLRRLHLHPRLTDNAEGTVLELMTEGGLTDARIAAHESLLGGLIQITYYDAGRSLP